MGQEDRYIRFDWAAKRMLRDKANYGVLEGLLTVLLGEQVKIEEILESEGNQEADDDKFNRVDIMARNSKDELIIVEIQQTRQIHYLERMLYGVSKVITDNMHLGEPYSRVKKVYSINIVYFSLGQGRDYLYHGTTQFVGVHTGDTLEVNAYESDTLRMRSPKEVFPEYYIIRVNEFNSVARTPLEEWIAYLKTGAIKADTQAPGLQEARRKLQLLAMSDGERRAYERHLDAQVLADEAIDRAHIEGREEGREEGRKEGREEGRREGREEGLTEGISLGELRKAEAIARQLLAMGLEPPAVARATGLAEAAVEALAKQG